MHLAIDLIYHSPLSFYFGKRLIEKGYPEVLIIGDTRCGKSETSKKLIEHYRLGSRSSGENTTQAGLVGGLYQIRNGWRVAWGRIPLNDGRLLFIDEVSGLLANEIAQMSDMRSSGIAELTKIQTERTLARTRLVWLSNPRSADSISNFGSGVTLIDNLIGKPEDIARFDFVIILDKDEISEADADERNQPNVPHVYTSELCHNLIMWAWSRRVEQVIVDAATIDACHEFARKMSKKYSSDCPIVNSMEQKIKLARLSVALACRLFSCDSTGQKVVVKPEHVAYIHKFLNEQYDLPHFGYDMFSHKKLNEGHIKNEAEIKKLVEEWGTETCWQVLDDYQITTKYIEESTGSQYDHAKVQLSTLLRNRCIKKRHGFFVKTPAFIKYLKNFLANPTKRKKEYV